MPDTDPDTAGTASLPLVLPLLLLVPGTEPRVLHTDCTRPPHLETGLTRWQAGGTDAALTSWHAPGCGRAASSARTRGAEALPGARPLRTEDACDGPLAVRHRVLPPETSPGVWSLRALAQGHAERGRQEPWETAGPALKATHPCPVTPCPRVSPQAPVGLGLCRAPGAPLEVQLPAGDPVLQAPSPPASGVPTFSPGAAAQALRQFSGRLQDGAFHLSVLQHQGLGPLGPSSLEFAEFCEF